MVFSAAAAQSRVVERPSAGPLRRSSSTGAGKPDRGRDHVRGRVARPRVTAECQLIHLQPSQPDHLGNLIRKHEVRAFPE